MLMQNFGRNVVCKQLGLVLVLSFPSGVFLDVLHAIGTSLKVAL